MFDRNKNESEDNIMKKSIMMLLGGLAVVSRLLFQNQVWLRRYPKKR